jgi:prevent-host-death family protein
MSMSVAQSRQNLSALIVAAQQEPQIITSHNKPVAVLVSADYFQKTANSVSAQASIYQSLMHMREIWPPLDDSGLINDNNTAQAWQRGNAFSDTE